MNSAAWDNIAKCADARASEKTFSWDEENSPLGDLVTREMARMLSYRFALIEGVSRQFLKAHDLGRF
jgi:hypothetical protein